MEAEVGTASLQAKECQRLSATARNYGEAWEDVLCNLQRSMTLFQPSQLLEREHVHFVLNHQFVAFSCTN
jgi:hypothetical protein